MAAQGGPPNRNGGNFVSYFDETAPSPPVLLVDDSDANLLALEAVLSSLDVSIVSVRSGKEALEAVERQMFAVALVDVQMPEIDGFELTLRLRKTRHGRDLPIVLVTAIHRDEQFVRKGYATGAADYITKPYDPQVIRARVRAFIGLYRQREAVRRSQVALYTQERDEAIRRLVAFERISAAVLETNDIEALLAELLGAFIAAADAADSAAILLRDGEWLRVAASVGGHQVDSDTLRTRIGKGFAGLIAAERKPFEINDDELRRVVQSSSFSTGGVRALYGVPLMHDGELLGVAHIGSTRATNFSASEKRLFLAAAERASLAVAKQLEVSVLSEVLENAPAYIAIVSATAGEYTFANAAMRQLFCTSLAGVKCAELGFGAEAARVIEQAKLRAERVEIPELKVDSLQESPNEDRPCFFRFTVQPLRNASGSVDRILVVAIDISLQVQGRMAVEQAQLARARLLERERAARVAAESASTAKDEFLATVSHELRTPLNAILGWASIARSHPEADKERALAVIERNARAQARIVDDVLDFARMAKGKMRLALSSIAVSKIVDAALESVRPAAEAKNVSFELDFRLTSPLVGDEERLQQVVWNLLSNAVKFSAPGGVIEVRGSSDDRKTSLSITDTGQGIDPAFLPYVFEPFRQANGTTTRRHGGLGLGLAIVRQIVNAHGGTIEARSEGLGRGATFFVELPMTDSVPREHRTSPEPALEGPHVAGAEQRLDGMRVLVIDDDGDSREFMEQALCSRGAHVVSVGSANEALAELERARPHVIVSDIAMPEVDGYELVQRVRALPVDQGGSTPALALTAHASKEIHERALQSGFHRYASKPVDVETFVAAVAELGRPVNH